MPIGRRTLIPAIDAKRVASKVNAEESIDSEIEKAAEKGNWSISVDQESLDIDKIGLIELMSKYSLNGYTVEYWVTGDNDEIVEGVDPERDWKMVTITW